MENKIIQQCPCFYLSRFLYTKCNTKFYFRIAVKILKYLKITLHLIFVDIILI